jgi:hypothetical protein
MHKQSIYRVVCNRKQGRKRGAQLGIQLHIRRAHYTLLGDLGPQEHTNTYLALSTFGSKAMNAHSTTIRFAWTPSFLACLLCFGSRSAKALYGVALLIAPSAPSGPFWERCAGMEFAGIGGLG